MPLNLINSSNKDLIEKKRANTIFKLLGVSIVILASIILNLIGVYFAMQMIIILPLLIIKEILFLSKNKPDSTQGNVMKNILYAITLIVSISGAIILFFYIVFMVGFDPYGSMHGGGLLITMVLFGLMLFFLYTIDRLVILKKKYPSTAEEIFLIIILSIPVAISIIYMLGSRIG